MYLLLAVNQHELGRSSDASLGIPFCAFADMDAMTLYINSLYLVEAKLLILLA